MSPLSGRSVVGACIVAAVVAAIAAAFVYVGSPGEARQRRFDDQRVGDLTEIVTSLDAYWRTNTRLPMSLEEAARGGAASVPRDPESGEPYAYRIVDDRHYEVCATFARPSTDVPAMHEPPFRGHAAGRQCFTLEVKASR
ncbi:MAG: hypothetical protein ACM4AI_05220 [Acidobacteriota bacterium]